MTNFVGHHTALQLQEDDPARWKVMAANLDWELTMCGGHGSRGMLVQQYPAAKPSLSVLWRTLRRARRLTGRKPCTEEELPYAPGVGEDVVAKVTEWLMKTGYPLETRIARSIGHPVSLGRFYRDADTGVWRETDVVATLMASDCNGQVVVSFVIEAKNTDSPWVIHLGNRQFRKDEDLVQTLHHVAEHAGVGNLTGVWSHPLLTYAGDTGYRLAAMSKNADKNEAWDALMQLMSAVRGLQAEAAERHAGGSTPVVELFVPILVTSGPLLTASMNASGEVLVEPVTRHLLVSQLPPDGQVRAVWIVQKDGIDTMARDIHESLPGLNTTGPTG